MDIKDALKNIYRMPLGDVTEGDSIICFKQHGEVSSSNPEVHGSIIEIGKHLIEQGMEVVLTHQHRSGARENWNIDAAISIFTMNYGHFPLSMYPDKEEVFLATISNDYTAIANNILEVYEQHKEEIEREP